MVTSVWTDPVSISGEGETPLLGQILRVDLTSVPDYLSRQDGTPPFWRYLGSIGYVYPDGRDLGTSIRWEQQQLPVPGADATAVWWRMLPNVLGSLYQDQEEDVSTRVGCSVGRPSAQSIPDATTTSIQFNNEIADPYGLHSLSVNPERITVDRPGWYAITAGISWAPNATGIRQLAIRLNGATSLALSAVQAVTAVGVATQQSVSRVTYLSAGDYLEMRVYQDSGGALDAEDSGYASPDMAIALL